MATSVAISALGALTTVATGDVLPIVDISDTTQAPTGSTKKITVANLLAGYLTSAAAGSTYLPLAGGTLTGALSGTTLTLSSSLNVGTTASITGNVGMGGNLSVAGTTTLGNISVITTSGSDNSVTFTQSGPFKVSGSAMIGGSLTVSSSMTLSGALGHTGVTAGFFGTTPSSKPSLFGSRAGACSLAVGLLSALAGLGLITDGTTP